MLNSSAAPQNTCHCESCATRKNGGQRDLPMQGSDGGMPQHGNGHTNGFLSGMGLAATPGYDETIEVLGVFDETWVS